MGKKLVAHDSIGADVQKMSDADLTDVITYGRNKMPRYSTLKPEEVKGPGAYIRTKYLCPPRKTYGKQLRKNYVNSRIDLPTT